MPDRSKTAKPIMPKCPITNAEKGVIKNGFTVRKAIANSTNPARALDTTIR